MKEPALERIERFYHRFAGVYDLFFDQVFREGRRLAVEAMMARPGDLVLEVGAGTGLNFDLYPPGVRAVGIDLSRPMLTEAQRRLARRAARDDGDPAPPLVQMDALRLAFPDGAFDAVYAPYVVSVVPKPRRLVAEMARVCRPGGRVIVVNHFGSRHPIGSWLERTLTPITHHVGFRLDLPVESILGIPQLVKVEDRRVNLLKMWRLLVFEKRPAARGDDASPAPREADAGVSGR